MYTTEYRRSFANRNWFTPHTDTPKKQVESQIEVMSPRPNVNIPQKCSIGIQANFDTKRVHFQPEPARLQVNLNYNFSNFTIIIVYNSFYSSLTRLSHYSLLLLYHLLSQFYSL